MEDGKLNSLVKSIDYHLFKEKIAYPSPTSFMYDFNMMIRKNIPLLAFIFCLIPALAFAAPPKGAVKLASKDRFKSGSFYCGKIKSKWIPGRMISGGYFYSHGAERSNVVAQAKRATGKKKKTLNAKAALLKSQITSRTPTCQSGATPTPTPTPSSQALKFNLSNAVGLALGNTSASSFSAARISAISEMGSNMRKVKSTGQMEEVVTSGSATINKFLIAPNDKIYVLFSSGTNLENTSATGNCLLAEIDKDSGDPVCIENALSSIGWDTPNKAIQFDGSGAIYYTGQDSSGKRVLRKNLLGQKTDLINDNIYLSNFLILSDGRAIITGTTQNTNAQWIRRLSASGGLTNLYTSTPAQFIKQFPDGNIYLGTWGNSTFGIVRYLTNSDAVDPQTYIIGEGLNGITYNPVFDATPFCDNGQASTYQGFCGTYGASVKGLHRTTSNKMYAISGYSDQGVLMEYYPTLARPTTVVRKISVFQGVINNLILAGLNAQDKNVMTLFDTSDDSEVELIGPSNEIEIYRINYVAGENKIMFDGLRFSDNKYVLGQIDLNTMQVTASQTGSTKLEDFQTFN